MAERSKGDSKSPRHRQLTKEVRSLKRKRDKEDLGKLQESVDNFDPKVTAAKKFTDLPLSELTARGLRDSHFETLTDIQSRAIPLALKGSDILGAAKTGSGKTLAFIVPLLEKLYRERWTELDSLGALVLSPTRELAVQIFEVLRKVGRHHSFSAGLVIGGKSLKEEAERLSRMNILVCTPGRMLQHLDQTSGLDVDSLQMLVLDEADRIMDMGFQGAVDALVEHLPRARQTMLFSATQSKKVSDLARLSLKDPEYVSVHESAASATPATLQQHYIVTPLPEKLDTLYGFIKTNLKSKMIVFMSSGKQVRFVYESFRQMQPGIPLLHLHGRQKQVARLEITSRFAAAKQACLFATDVVARGVDFPAVDWVVQLDAPEDADTYIHRVGRTARFESDGRAVLFLDPSEEAGMLKRLEQKKVPIQKVHVREKKRKSIQDQLQSMCWKQHDVKYLAQKSFISYARSVHLQRDKEVFRFDQLDLEGFARSLGLAGAPQIRFQKGEDVKRLKNAPRAALSSESDSESGEEEGRDAGGRTEKNNKKKKKDEVRTKAQKMFERTNQDVLSKHYSALVDKEGPEEEEGDFFKTKRVLRGDELDRAAGDAGAGVGAAKVVTLGGGGGEPLVLDSKRREKLLRSKKQLLRFREKGQKLIFDDEGNAHPVYVLRDEDEFRREGPVEELRRRFVGAEADRVREADADDKALARARRREKRLRQKARERGGEELGPVVGLGGDGSDGGEGGGGVEEDPLALLRSLPINGAARGSGGEEEEDREQPPRKKAKKKWFQRDEDDEEDERPKNGRRRVIEVDHEPDTLEDYEALAAGLLEE